MATIPLYDVYDQDEGASVAFAPILTAISTMIGGVLLALGVVLVGVASGAWTMLGACVALAFGLAVLLTASVGGLCRVER